MSSELMQLLKEVEQLRKETDALVCRCNQPSCPFHKSKSSPGSQTSLNSLTFSQSSEDWEGDSRLILRRQWTPPRAGDPVHSRSTGNLSCIVPGVQRRADGTIIEGDGPGYSIGQGIKMRRCGTYNGFTQTNRLDINTIRETEDCTVDYENTFSAEGYEFSRQAPERKQFRSPKVQKKHSKLKNSVSYPVTSAHDSPSGSQTLNSSSDSESNGGSPKQRARSSSSPSVSTARRHSTLEQGSQRWKSGSDFGSTRQA